MAAMSAVLLTWLAAGVAPAAAGLPETIERVKPSIVAVGTFQRTRNPPFAFRGTGFVVGDGTVVVTNAHVLPDALQADQKETLVVLAAGTASADARGAQARDVKLLAVDKEHDVALLRLSGAPLPALKIGDSGAVREGLSVAFTGFPLGYALGFVPVTHRGIVAALTPIVLPAPGSPHLDEAAIRRLRAGAFVVFQLDATAYPGNSGSPVYDPETGQVIGVINMVFVKNAKESALREPSGISFAVPARHLQELLREAK